MEPVDVALATEVIRRSSKWVLDGGTTTLIHALGQVPVPKTFVDMLEDRIADNQLVLQPSARGESTIQEMLELAEAQTTIQGVENGSNSAKHMCESDQGRYFFLL